MYGRNYLRVRVQDTSEGNTIQNGSCKIHHYVIEIHIRTGKSDHLIGFTKKTKQNKQTKKTNIGGSPEFYRKTAATSVSLAARNSGHSSSRTPGPAVHRAEGS